MSETQTEIGPRIGDQVFEAMQASILNGEYRSGQRLRIRQLATALDTSVMPVRESLARLEEVGLVETSPHRSAVVKTSSISAASWTPSMPVIRKPQQRRPKSRSTTRSTGSGRSWKSERNDRV